MAKLTLFICKCPISYGKIILIYLQMSYILWQNYPYLFANVIYSMAKLTLFICKCHISYGKINFIYLQMSYILWQN